MHELELKQCSRFKAVRETLGIKQADFSKSLAISQGHTSDIENGRKAVSDRIIEILSLKFNVSEKWLRTGDGTMFNDLTRDEQIASFVGNMLADEKDSFKRRFISMLSRLDESEWRWMEQKAKELVSAHDNRDSQ